MLPSKKQPDSWREALKYMGRCPACQKEYPAGQAKVFAREDAAGMIHLTCPSCYNSFLAVIAVGTRGVSTVGMVTDLTYEDAQRIFRSEPVSIDEILEGRDLIKNKYFNNNKDNN